MTEDEWLTSIDRDMMLDWLSHEGRLKRRLACLFAAACCRRIWSMFSDPRSTAVIEIVERLVDGYDVAEQLISARIEAELAAREAEEIHRQTESRKTGMVWMVRYAAASVGTAVEKWDVYTQEIAETVAGVVGYSAVSDQEYMTDLETDLFVPAQSREKAEQCHLLRDIFGNPYHSSPPLNRRLLTPRVLDLAHIAYNQRSMPQGTFRTESLLSLADALKEAGCEDEAALTHLREPGVLHVRGCQVVDLLLKKNRD